MKVGDTVKCNTEGLDGFTKDFLYKIDEIYFSGNIRAKNNDGDLRHGKRIHFDLYKPSKTGWQQMQEAAGVKVDFITPTCDFGCKYAFGNEHLEGCSLTGEIK